jgi:hypothetical protein
MREKYDIDGESLTDGIQVALPQHLSRRLATLPVSVDDE